MSDKKAARPGRRGLRLSSGVCAPRSRGTSPGIGWIGLSDVNEKCRASSSRDDIDADFYLQ